MDLPFIVKKSLEIVLYPSGIIFIFLFLALLVSFSRYRRSQTRFFLALGAFLFYLFSTPWVPNLMLKPLEKKYPLPSPQEMAQAKAVVLLPASVISLPGMPLAERLGLETSKRFLVALTLAKREELPLIVVGGGWPAGKGSFYLAQLAKNLGLTKVEAYDQANDTKSSARVLQKRLRETPFLLVSSAYHLPRAVYLFRKYGLSPIPYPAFKLSIPAEFCWSNLWPDPLNLFRANRATHEYLGLAFYWTMDHLAFVKGS